MTSLLPRPDYRCTYTLVPVLELFGTSTSTVVQNHTYYSHKTWTSSFLDLTGPCTQYHVHNSVSWVHALPTTFVLSLSRMLAHTNSVFVARSCCSVGKYLFVWVSYLQQSSFASMAPSLIHKLALLCYVIVFATWAEWRCTWWGRLVFRLMPHFLPSPARYYVIIRLSQSASGQYEMHPAIIVISAETIKLFISLCLLRLLQFLYCINVISHSGCRFEGTGASYAKMLHTFKARDYLMIAPAFMYALYNNLTFDNLKSFDANIFHVSLARSGSAFLPSPLLTV